MACLIRAFSALVIFTALVASDSVALAKSPPSAAIVMDMRNGKILMSRSADRRLHPASLTKMMTLYLAFEAIRDGRLSPSKRVRISRRAARQPASKLRLRAGQRVSIRSLIRATAIKSANDAAMALAEAIGGSKNRFARMMTERARQLGMRNTRFRNPHGLTERGHYSTARDMAILGRHLFFDFPKYYNIFRRKTDQAAGRRIWTTNKLLSVYEGADGIKTGYTRAAGYNLVASARRGKKRIVGVVFGAPNSHARTRRMRTLLDIGFSRAPRHARKVRPRDRRFVRRRGQRLARFAPVPPMKPARTIRSPFSSSAMAAAPTRPEPARPALRDERPGVTGAPVSTPPAAGTPAETAEPRVAAASSPFAPMLGRPPAKKLKPIYDEPERKRGMVPFPPRKPKPLRLASR